MKNVFKNAAIVLMLAIGVSACDKEPEIEIDKDEFCSYFNMENIHKTIPYVNEFLATLPNNTSRERTFEHLETWFNSFSCNINARILWGVDLIWGQNQMRGVGIPIKDGERVRMLEVDFAIIEYRGNLIVTHSQIDGFSHIKQDAINVKTNLTQIDEVFDFINASGLDRYLSFMYPDSVNLGQIRSSLLAKSYVGQIASHLHWGPPDAITFFIELLNMHNLEYQKDWIETMKKYKLVENAQMMIQFRIPEGTGKEWETKFENLDFVHWAERSYTTHRIR